MQIKENVIQTISEAQKLWAITDSTIELIADRENQVYRVDTPEGPLALRLHRKGYRKTSEIESELLWMDMLSTNGVCVPKPIAALDGSHHKLVNGVSVSVLSWLSGKPFSQLTVTPQMFFNLGRELSRMHTLADAWLQPAEFNRPTWDLLGDNPTWDRFWDNPLLTPTQTQQFAEFRGHAKTVIEELKPVDKGLIHADLVPDNVLLDEYDKLQFIDFDDGGYGYRLFDLATITHRSRYIRNDDTLANATIDGYSRDRDIDRAELLLFEALRACTYIGWNMTRINESNGLERNARFISAAETAIQRYYSL